MHIARKSMGRVAKDDARERTENPVATRLLHLAGRALKRERPKPLLPWLETFQA